MWTRQSEQQPTRRRKLEGGDAESGLSNQALLSLDYRVRNLEGRSPAWFMPEADSVLTPVMQEAHKHYDSRSAGKGKAHPDGHRRTTLAGALLLKLSECNLNQAEGLEILELQRRNKILTLAGMPVIDTQQNLPKRLVAELNTPAAM